MTQNAAGSPLVVANSLVYFSGSNDSYLYALNAATGTIGWRYPMLEPAFAAVADGTLYISAIDPATGETDLYALDARQGTLLWQVPIAQQELPNIMPVMANEVVYFTASGTYAQNGIESRYSLAYAYRAKDGKLLWRSQNFPAFLTTPPTVANGVLYAGAQNGIYALKASDGELLWRYDAGGQVSAPLQVVDEVIYAGVWQKDAPGEGLMLALNAGDASVRWKAQIASYTGYDQQYAVVNGVCYVTADGYAYALDTVDGSTHWRTKFSAPSPLGGALIVAP
jgi:outer membrane protein assembly factor BamB